MKKSKWFWLNKKNGQIVVDSKRLKQCNPKQYIVKIAEDDFEIYDPKAFVNNFEPVKNK